MEAHTRAVAAISNVVKSFHDDKTPFRIYHGSTNSTRVIHLDAKKVVDISALSHVIKVDTDALTATVEPNVPMDKLVATTLRYGLIPPVVPEFPGITVGGSFSGTAAESSSFRYGFFDRTVNWVEMILANGDRVRASPTHLSDLFYGAVGAFGTLGVATLLEIQLVATGKYVEVEFLPVKSTGEAMSLLKQCSRESYDYLDGILFSPVHGVIVAGRRISDTDPPKHPVQRFTRARDPWFYLFAEKQIQHTSVSVPVADYMFRYDRGTFWMGRYSFHMFVTPFNRLTRFLLDPLMKTRKMYQALHHSGQSQRFIIQDLALPVANAKTIVDEKSPKPAPRHFRDEDVIESLIINVGVWGPGHGYGTDDAEFARFIVDNRELEAKVTKLGGLKWLYAHAYYTEEEFWSLYNREEYDKLRAVYHAGTLPTLYDKIKSSEERENASESRGLLRALLGKKHLLAKKEKVTGPRSPNGQPDRSYLRCEELAMG